MPPHSESWPDKVFVFEHKGVDEGRGGKPIVWIRMRQLLVHLFEDRARGGNLVYYLLPDPEWTEPNPAPYGTVPDVAWRRTRGPKLPSGGFLWGGFQEWARVVHVEDVLRRIRSIHLAAPHRFIPRPGAEKGGQDWVCALNMSEVRALRGQVSLRDFLSGVRRCTHGRLARDGSLRLGAPSPAVPPLSSLEDALALAAEKEREGEDSRRRGEGDISQPGDWKQEDLLEEGDAQADVFQRPAFMTAYGVGDSELRGEQEEASSLF